MTAAGDQVLAYAYTQLGTVEEPPNSNQCSPYTDAWGAGAWCAMFVSYCADAAGFPLPAINGPAGFSYCPDGQIAAYSTGHSVGAEGVEAGDALIFSWEPFYYGSDSIAYCSSGVYAGAPAGDHTGYFVEWIGGSYMRTIEGNTSQSSWDNGGAVMERTDRYVDQICCYARHEALNTGGSTQPPEAPKPKDECMLARNQDNGMIFVVGAEGKRPISGEEANIWAAAGITSVDVPAIQLVRIPDVPRYLGRDTGNGSIWLVDAAGRRQLGSEEYNWHSTHTAADVWDAPSGMLGTIPDATV